MVTCSDDELCDSSVVAGAGTRILVIASLSAIAVYRRRLRSSISQWMRSRRISVLRLHADSTVTLPLTDSTWAHDEALHRRQRRSCGWYFPQLRYKAVMARSLTRPRA